MTRQNGANSIPLLAQSLVQRHAATTGISINLIRTQTDQHLDQNLSAVDCLRSFFDSSQRRDPYFLVFNLDKFPVRGHDRGDPLSTYPATTRTQFTPCGDKPEQSGRTPSSPRWKYDKSRTSKTPSSILRTFLPHESRAEGCVSRLVVYVSAGPHSILILGRFTRITQTGRACLNRKVHGFAAGRGCC